MWKFSYSFLIMAIFYFINWIVAAENIEGWKLLKGGNYSRKYGIMKNLPRRRILLYWCHLLSFWYAGPKAVKLAKIQHKLFWKLSWFSSQVVFRTILRPCLYVQLFFRVKMKICDHVCADWRCPLYFSSLSQARWKIWATRPLLATGLRVVWEIL